MIIFPRGRPVGDNVHFIGAFTSIEGFGIKIDSIMVYRMIGAQRCGNRIKGTEC